MTINIKVGDQGQRYEVHAKWKDNGKDFIVGWTEREDGGGIFKMVRMHPAMRGGYVIDRKTKEVSCPQVGTDLPAEDGTNKP